MSRSAAPELLPIFRSVAQGELLAYLLMAPVERSAGELSSTLGISPGTLSRELDRLVRAGILVERRVGKARLVSAATASPLVAPLTELVVPLFGPRVVLVDEFSDVPGVEEIWIFGSWAARYSGVKGRPPADIDVLVVGRPDRSAMYDAAQRAERRLGVPVNTTVRSVEKWRHRPDQFVEQLREKPLVPVTQQGDEHPIG